MSQHYFGLYLLELWPLTLMSKIYNFKANIMSMARGVIFVSLLFFSFFSHLLYSISYNITHEYSSEGRRWGNPTKTSPILGHFPYIEF